MGLEVPDSGTVQGVGRVGAVFQEDRLCPQLTAVQNVELVLPEEKHNTKRKSCRIFNDLDMMSRRLLCLPGSFPAGRSAVRPCSALSGPGAIPCCWTNPSPAWTGDHEKAAALLKERRGERAVLLATHDREAIRELGWRVIDLT